MIVSSIRLLNIKCFGSGADGRGVTISFEPGANRISGRNGRGKSSLIESLGYALFMVRPEYAENFRLDTYMLKSGESSGEIDVVFEEMGDAYRVERGLGKSKRRSKVVQLSDESICAEDDAEVAAFLSRLFGFDGAVGRLPELFSKLAGVKQGRLTWPFDSKPSEKRRFFEPLLDVAVFRDCFDRLKPTYDSFMEDFQEMSRCKAAVEQKIIDRADSPELLSKKQQECENCKKKIQELTTAELHTRSQRDVLQAHANALVKARDEERDMRQKEELLAERHRQDVIHVKEADKAAKTVRDTEDSHQQYLAAECRLRELTKMRRKYDTLKSDIAKLASKRSGLEASNRAGRIQIEAFSQQRTTKATQAEALKDRKKELQMGLQTGLAAFETAMTFHKRANECRRTIESVLDYLPDKLNALKLRAESIRQLSDQLENWNRTDVLVAAEEDKRSDEMLCSCRNRLAASLQKHISLGRQLEQLGDGICPFLNEKCEQFDPKRQKEDLSQLGAEVRLLTIRVQELETSREACAKALEQIRGLEKVQLHRTEQLKNELDGYFRDSNEMFPPRLGQAIDELTGLDEQFCAAPEPPSAPSEAPSIAGVIGLMSGVAVYAQELEAWWRGSRVTIDALDADYDLLHEKRQRDETTCEELEAQILSCAEEGTLLNVKIEELNEKTRLLEEKICANLQNKDELKQQMGDFAELDEQIAENDEKRSALQECHEAYLVAAAGAKELSSYRSVMYQSAQDLAAIREQTAYLHRLTGQSEQRCKPDELQKLTERLEECLGLLIMSQNELGHASAALALQQQRHQEWLSSCEEKEQLDAAIARTSAAASLTQVARSTLQKAAPAVAQHICEHIAFGAQAIYNQISPDPVELVWDATQYSLCIIPGERRFAMLSGGEQTKLALAMTLAMIEEFSSLRFCVFDEPTYGVDAESRPHLADAILRAGEAAGLEQLFIVSHDDAFEGSIENGITLGKNVG